MEQCARKQPTGLRQRLACIIVPVMLDIMEQNVKNTLDDVYLKSPAKMERPVLTAKLANTAVPVPWVMKESIVKKTLMNVYLNRVSTAVFALKRLTGLQKPQACSTALAAIILATLADYVKNAKLGMDEQTMEDVPNANSLKSITSQQKQLPALTRSVPKVLALSRII
tara:strand:- start:329 stop:832 length:504 start_codon:yes stop_codon:yes gene_type:complete